jgi:hypothetical protein
VMARGDLFAAKEAREKMVQCLFGGLQRSSCVLAAERGPSRPCPARPLVVDIGHEGHRWYASLLLPAPR